MVGPTEEQARERAEKEGPDRLPQTHCTSAKWTGCGEALVTPRP